MVSSLERSVLSMYINMCMCFTQPVNESISHGAEILDFEFPFMEVKVVDGHVFAVGK